MDEFITWSQRKGEHKLIESTIRKKMLKKTTKKSNLEPRRCYARVFTKLKLSLITVKNDYESWRYTAE